MSPDELSAGELNTGETALAEQPLPSNGDLRWGSGASTLDRLFADGGRFSFYQAVRALSLLHNGAAPASHGSVPVRFRSRMSFDFPGDDIERIAPPSHDEALPQMLVNFLGLAGAHGPLPVVFTEQLLRPRNSALRDFLDIFNHRLVLLLYRVHEMHHPELTAGSPDEGLAADHLYSFFGLGRDPGSAARYRLWVPDRALLHYSGILAHRPHSASGLQRVLADYFHVDVAIEEFVGAWLDLSEDQWTRIGASQGRNHGLGQETVLGKRVWDQHARIIIQLGPLDLDSFERFLPGRVAYKPLQSLTRFYLGDEVDFSFRLVLRADEVPSVAPYDIRDAASPVRQIELGRLSWLESGRLESGRTNGARTAMNNGVVMIDGDL
ncbi:type VI secretion system protein ImpH [Silvibacterium bohemicum]|uniref:Type VI secretion system protein ImpH n=1 Tax=Silvibacterium bohemicum TaxID=1577686 RepID=A0A841JT13_9BACT|nr:type VI secretion system baseplate subunit TssG [Silvibacterium bohemicum]MBB6143625.1 type VI secretion system protein ImpH [Silvibacterium bohemicum]